MNKIQMRASFADRLIAASDPFTMLGIQDLRDLCRQAGEQIKAMQREHADEMRELERASVGEAP